MPLGKLQTNILKLGHKVWKLIAVADQTIWVTNIDVHGKGPLSDEITWNQVTDPAHTALSAA